MKYGKNLFFLFSIFIVLRTQAEFNPRFFVEIMDATGKLKAQARLRVFAPESNSTQSTINKFTNYLIPSKQEVLEKLAAEHIQHPKIAAFTVVALYEAYEKCGAQPFQKVGADAFKEHLNESARLAFYNFWKQLLIQKVREKIDPYLKEGVKKTDILQNVKNRRFVAALGYVAHRSVNCALDMACDATIELIKNRFVK